MSDLVPIIHMDRLFVVVEKPPGLLSVPGRGPDKTDCVVSRIRDLVPGCPDQPAVHRLDMDTSGLMVIARTVEAHKELSTQFAERRVRKQYQAVVDGVVHGESGEIVLAFRLDPQNRPYQVYDPIHGKKGRTGWRKLSLEGKKTRVEFIPYTGRTHQLRLHAAHVLGLGLPIVGDRLYGTRKPGQRMLLHANRLCFFHPQTGTPLCFDSEVPF